MLGLRTEVGEKNEARRDVRDALGRIGRDMRNAIFLDEMRLWNVSRSAPGVESHRLARRAVAGWQTPRVISGRAPRQAAN